MRQYRAAMDAIEVHAPSVAALAVRILFRMPAAVRRRALVDAFTRAQNAFNRGDFAAVCALWADDVEYVPPPPLHAGEPLVGRTAVLQFWRDVLERYERNTIANLSIEEVGPSRFVRTARLSHSGPGEQLDYTIRQTTELHRGRVVRQVNEALPGS